MKNRKKALIIAIICLAVAAVLYLLVVKLSQRSEDADSSDDSLVISSVDSGQITAISYEKDGKSLSFRKEDGTWYNAEDKSFPVDQDSLTTMTNALGAVSATRKLDSPEDLSEYGLDSPVLTVRYTASDGKEAEFTVGDTNDTIAEVGFNCGYNNLSNFNRIFKRKKGCSPSEFRENYKKIKIIV